MQSAICIIVFVLVVVVASCARKEPRCKGEVSSSVAVESLQSASVQETSSEEPSQEGPFPLEDTEPPVD